MSERYDLHDDKLPHEHFPLNSGDVYITADVTYNMW